MTKKFEQLTVDDLMRAFSVHLAKVEANNRITFDKFIRNAMWKDFLNDVKKHSSIVETM